MILFFDVASLSNCKYELKKEIDNTKTKGLIHTILSGSKKYFKHENEFDTLKKMYSEVIRHYNNDIIKILELTDPVQISQSYIFAYKNGFLSKDCKFSYSVEDTVESPWMLGASILTGSGCCRHSSSLLSDIYSDCEINSSVINTACNNCKVIFNPNELSKSALDFIKTINFSRIKTDEDLLSILANNGIVLDKKWQYDREKVPKNHVITAVSYNGFAYYIDPTNNDYYIIDKETGRLVNSTRDIENTIKKISLGFNGITGDRKKIKIITSLPSVDLEYIKSISADTTLLCNNNYDLFQHFYKDNSVLYEEISEKLKKITK